VTRRGADGHEPASETSALPIDVARRLRELETLYESLQALTSTLEVGDVVRTVLDAIKRVTSAEALSLMLYDKERDELVFAASEMLCAETLVGTPPASRSAEDERHGRRLTVSLRRHGRDVGLLELRERHDDRPFDDGERRR
jgi:nitrate/nitrite-specific signal transduction histidine kinase